MSTVLVFDCGTSALKAALFANDGQLLGNVDITHPPAPGLHRRDPRLWWAAAQEACARLDLGGVEAIALTGAMENLIPVDAAGEPVADAILYPDPCGTAPLDRLLPALQGADAAAILGNAPEPLMSAFKIAAWRESDKQAFSRARYLLPGARDFLAFKLTGLAVTDPTCASTTGLMDIAARDWSAALLDIHGIDRDRLPEIQPATDVLGPLLPEAAEALGLKAGIPVVSGCGDAGATTIGSFADAPGDFSLYLGTSGWAARVAPAAAAADPAPWYRLAHPLGDGLIEIAPILSAGAAARWARDVLRLDLDQAEVLAATADRHPKDILFFPYLDGERSPFLDLDLRAAFMGLGSDATSGDLYYAVLEGVAFVIAANLAAMGRSDDGTVGLVGGGALSAVWPQLIADAIRAPVTLPAHPVSATAFGAFRIAQNALGRPDPIAAEARLVTPRPERLDRATVRQQNFTVFSQTLRGFSR